MSAPTLRGQLTVASIATTFVALLVTAAALLAYELNTYRQAWVEDLRTQADLIARATSAAIVFNDPKAARENLALLERKHRIRAAAIYRDKGALFAAYRSLSGETLPRPKRPFVAPSERFSGGTLEVTYPIEHNGERIGSVYLRAEHDIRDRVLSYLSILAAATLASLLLAALVFGKLQRVVTDPLSKITDVAQRVMARRDWNLRAPKARNRDIGVLVDAFNGMLDEVKKATGELEHETQVRRQAEARLQMADQRKDEFLAMLAHELRNPLAPMTNAAALLRLEDTSAAMRGKAADILDRQLRHMVRLIDDLLDISRIATGKLSLRVGNIDLVRVLHSAAELAEPAFAENRLSFSLEIPVERCVIVGDSARLLQVLSNLLGNAARYTPDGGSVRLSLRVHGDRVEIDVQDTGIGVAPDMQQRVFELFEQADKSLERGNVGLGIGLTLAQQLVQLHGGEIGLHSRGIGHGTTFTIRLPRAEAALEPDEPRHLPARAATRLRLVVADDNVDFAWSLRVLLESFEHEVIVVHDGVEALQSIRSGRPDIAILDIGMPEMNGYEVARRLRADPGAGETVLVALTGWGQASDREEASRAGFDHHLVKPVPPEELLALIGEYEAMKRAAGSGK